MHCEIHSERSPLTPDMIYVSINNNMPKRTFQPKKRTRAKVTGFIKRMSSVSGRAVLKRRRLKGRKSISN